MSSSSATPKSKSKSKLKAILFAGGVGRRLWPLSRVHTPKQFAPMLGDRSSFQLAVDRLADTIDAADIYVGTNASFAEQLRQQAAQIPESNFILEPVRRDVAAAVGLAFFTLEARGHRGPVLFQWSDNYVEHEDALLTSIAAARELIEADRHRIVFLGEKPRFANENLGWIEMGEALGETSQGVAYHRFCSWHYRPPKSECERFMASGRFIWNAGFFMSSVEFMTAAYRRLAPELAEVLEKIVQHDGRDDARAVLDQLYPTAPKLHFDQAILERLENDKAILLARELGWSDPGSLYSLKESLQASPEATVTQGECLDYASKDSLIINRCKQRPVVTVGLEGIIVVQNDDVTLVLHKDKVRDLTAVLEDLEAKGYQRIV